MNDLEFMISSRYFDSSLAILKLNFILFISRPYFLIQAMSKFMVVSRQAYELEKDRIELEAKVCDIEKESNCRAWKRVKLEERS